MQYDDYQSPDENSVYKMQKEYAKEPAKTNSEDNPVKKCKDHTQLGVTDALYKRAASAHYRKSREHPEYCLYKFARHIMNQGIVREYHKELFAKRYV